MRGKNQIWGRLNIHIKHSYILLGFLLLLAEYQPVLAAGPFHDNGDGTVSDIATGLTWQQGNGEDQKNRQDAATYCDGLELGGAGDWRLPDIYELKSIVDYLRGGPAINTDVFPDTHFSSYWSDTRLNTEGSDDSSASSFWSVEFLDGPIQTAQKSTPFFVRCVRGLPLVSSDFQVNGDGTVIDITTNRIWEINDIWGRVNWQDAKTECDKLELAGTADWRLPRIEELSGIVDYEEYQPAIDQNIFSDIKTFRSYWSASPVVDDDTQAWLVNFHMGEVVMEGTDDTALVRCVHVLTHNISTNVLPETDSGHISLSPEDKPPAGYEYNEFVTLEAQREEICHEFVEWPSTADNACSGEEPSCRLKMDADKSVTALFHKPSYSLAVTHEPEDGGMISLLPDSSSYECGEQVTLEAQPKEGYVFDVWQGDVPAGYSDKANPLVLTMDARDDTMPNERKITAVFRLIRYSLPTTFFSPINSGWIEFIPEAYKDDDGNEYYEHGDPVSLTFKPSSCRTFTHWEGDCAGQDETCNLIMDGEKSVIANSRKSSYSLTLISSPENGGMAVRSNPDATSYECNETVTLKAQVNPDYMFDEWKGDVSGIMDTSAEETAVKMNSAAGDREITAAFLWKGPTCHCSFTPEEGHSPLDVRLDGRASTDPENDIVKYSWLVNGERRQGSQADIRLIQAGEYPATLKVTDVKGYSDECSCQGEPNKVEKINVNSRGPVAVIGIFLDGDRIYTGSGAIPEDEYLLEVPVTKQVTFDGSESYHQESDISAISHAWSILDGEKKLKESFAPSFSYTFDTDGEYSVKLTVTDGDGMDSVHTKSFFVMIPSTNGQAIIIAAGGARPSNTLYPFSDKFTQRMYRLLKDRGLTDEDIIYMNPRAPLNKEGRQEKDWQDHDLSKPEQDLVYAFKHAKERLQGGGQQQFVFYLHGHAPESEKFMIKQEPYSELSAIQLHGFLEQLPSGVQQVIILDSCYSGSFLNELALSESEKAAGVERVVVTSADADTEAWSTTHRSFSDTFISSLRRGQSIQKAFFETKEMLETYSKEFRGQTPWLNDTDDGEYNPEEDGRLADTIYLVGEGIPASILPPRITAVHPYLSVQREEKTTLWVRIPGDKNTIREVRAVLMAPGFINDYYQYDGEEITKFSRKELTLTYIKDKERYEVTHDFNSEEGDKGIWRILYQAQNTDGIWSDQVEGEVQTEAPRPTIACEGPASCETCTSVSMGLNKSRYVPGEQLLLHMEVNNNEMEANGNEAADLDFYVAVLFPDGNFTTVTPLSFSWPNTIQPYRSDISITGKRIFPAVMDFPLPADIPNFALGSYKIYGALTKAGSNLYEENSLLHLDCSGFEIYRDPAK
ncbi:MAG: DUF1566 domain-containing protein [Gammaproteobacteria bacterium]|nr:DUF1566 domain-containing protein [Gammaproteobacteria bacterium]